MTQAPEMQAQSPRAEGAPRAPSFYSREAHFARVNARRAASGLPPLTEEDFPAPQPNPWEDEAGSGDKEDEPGLHAPPAPAPEEDDADMPPKLTWAEQREESLSTLDRIGWAEAHEAGGLRPFVSKVPPYAKPQPRLPAPAEKHEGFALPDAPALSGSAARVPDETEALLNGVIADCRLFLREIVFHSARLAALESDRTSFIDAASRMAKTAGGVGKQIAKLRRAANAGQIGENRQRIIVERVERLPAHMIAEREGGV